MESDHRQDIRYPLAEQRPCRLCVITFKDLRWKDHETVLKDICPGGVGIASGSRVGRGFVWFQRTVSGHRSGVLLWSRLVGSTYRAGIQFVPLTREQERRVGESVDQVRSHRPLRNPEAIIATILDALSRSDRAAD